MWTSTYGSVVKYIKERYSANLSLVANSQSQIVVNLTDTLDDAIFDEPLTIRSEVPANWATVSIQQGTGETNVTSVVEGTETVIYYNVVPDRGLITLQELTVHQPTVTDLGPSYATVGGPSFTLTVNGNYYVSGSTVRWNGSSRPTSFVSGSELKATITMSDISFVGTANISVRNPSGETSNEMDFEIRNAALTITIQKSGTGTGAVTGNGISCGTDCTEICTYGTVVTFTATAATGSTFSGWTGCGSVSREYVYRNDDCQ